MRYKTALLGYIVLQRKYECLRAYSEAYYAFELVQYISPYAETTQRWPSPLCYICSSQTPLEECSRCTKQMQSIYARTLTHAYISPGALGKKGKKML